MLIIKQIQREQTEYLFVKDIESGNFARMNFEKICIFRI